MSGKVSISTANLKEHAAKVDKFTTTINDINSRLDQMTRHLSAEWVDTNCQTFCTSVKELQNKQIKAFNDSLKELKTYMNSRADAYDDAFKKIKNAHN
jgi:uncharacterized protein YukE